MTKKIEKITKSNAVYEPARKKRLEALLEQQPNNKELQQALNPTKLEKISGKVDFSLGARVKWTNQ